MRPTPRDKARELLTELDELGTIDESAYDMSDGHMTWDQLQTQQDREMVAGRWQVMQARHWFHMAVQAENDAEAERLFTKGKGFYWEAMHHAKGNESRLTKLPDLGGAPSKAEAAALLYEVACNIIETENCRIIEGLRRAVKRNEFLKHSYSKVGETQLRRLFEKQRKISTP